MRNFSVQTAKDHCIAVGFPPESSWVTGWEVSEGEAYGAPFACSLQSISRGEGCIDNPTSMTVFRFFWPARRSQCGKRSCFTSDFFWFVSRRTKNSTRGSSCLNRGRFRTQEGCDTRFPSPSSMWLQCFHEQRIEISLSARGFSRIFLGL